MQILKSGSDRMRGIKSFAMVMCASNADHSIVEFLVPPEGSVPGDRVFFEGHEGTPFRSDADADVLAEV